MGRPTTATHRQGFSDGVNGLFFSSRPTALILHPRAGPMLGLSRIACTDSVLSARREVAVGAIFHIHASSTEDPTSPDDLRGGLSGTRASLACDWQRACVALAPAN